MWTAGTAAARRPSQGQPGEGHAGPHGTREMDVSDRAVRDFLGVMVQIMVGLGSRSGIAHGPLQSVWTGYGVGGPATTEGELWLGQEVSWLRWWAGRSLGYGDGWVQWEHRVDQGKG